jgi:hypothetical protein
MMTTIFSRMTITHQPTSGRLQEAVGCTGELMHWRTVFECLTAACKALSLANAKEKGTHGLVIRSLDD